MKMKQTILSMIIISLILTSCAGSAAASVEVEPVNVPEADVSVQSESIEPDASPEGWSEATHGDEVEPNYEVVFPDDEVKQITITISPEDWEAMQVNMTDLFGEAGSGEAGRNFPGGGEMPEGIEPPEGFELPEGFEPPEGVKPPGGGFHGQNEGSAPPENMERPGFLEGDPNGSPPMDGGFGGGDMTSENPMWVSATIEFEGLTWTHVGVRYKGNSSLTSGWQEGTLKLPLKLDFDEFEDEYSETENQRFYGFKQLSLANGFSDTSFMRDAATSLILEEAGLPAAKTAFYEVVIDYGEGPVTLGLYTMIEVIDDTVVERYFGDDDGNIYEGEGAAASFAASTYNQIEESFQKENNEDEADWSDIEALFDVLHADLRTTDPAAWRAELESQFDVDGFLEWLAIAAVIEHWDSYGSMNHNYNLYNNPDTGQLTWISWDHNQVMSEGMGGGRDRGPGKGISLDKSEIDDSWPLIRYLLDEPIYYEAYLGYIEATIEGPFDPDRMAEIYQSFADLIAPYAAADVGEAAFDTAVQQLIEYAYQRTEAVETFLATAGQ